MCVRVINRADENQRSLLYSACISRREKEVLRPPRAHHHSVS